MTAEEVARYINVNVRTVYRKVNSEELPCYRPGRKLRFKKEEIDNAMKGGNNGKKRNTRSRSTLAG